MWGGGPVANSDFIALKRNHDINSLKTDTALTRKGSSKRLYFNNSYLETYRCFLNVERLNFWSLSNANITYWIWIKGCQSRLSITEICILFSETQHVKLDLRVTLSSKYCKISKHWTQQRYKNSRQSHQIEEHQVLDLKEWLQRKGREKSVLILWFDKNPHPWNMGERLIILRQLHFCNCLQN